MQLLRVFKEIDQLTTYYVSKSGSNSNDGLTVNRPFLTFTYALTKASSGDNIVCVDNGTYTENLTCKDSVNIYAPNARLSGAHTLADNHQFTFYMMDVADGATGLTKGGTSVAYIDVKRITVGNASRFLRNDSSTVSVKLGEIAIGTGSSLYYATGGGLSVCYLAFDNIEFGGLGGGFLVNANMPLRFQAIGNRIYEQAASTLFSNSPGSASTISLTVNDLTISTLSNINANVTADLSANVASGTLLNIGANRVNIQPYGAGIAYGLATLDSTAKVPLAQLPAGIFGGMTFKGTWDASGGVYPAAPSTGDYYVISVAGTISGTTYTVNDYMIYNGSSWDKIDNANIYLKIDQTVAQTTVGTFTFPTVNVTNTVTAEQLTSTDDINATDDIIAGGDLSSGNDALIGRDVVTARDVNAGRDVMAIEDVVALKDGYTHGDHYFGQGYGSGGGLGFAGVIAHDGSACFQGNWNLTAGGVRIMEDYPSTPTSIGAKGELVYGTSTWNFLCQAIADLTWRKIRLSQSGGIGEIFEGATGSISMAVSDMNKFLYNTNVATYTLPAYNATGMQVGDRLSIYVGSANYFRITLSGSDTARYIGTTTAAGGYFRSNTRGSKLTMVNTGTSEWAIIDLDGTWTYDS